MFRWTLQQESEKYRFLIVNEVRGSDLLLDEIAKIARGNAINAVILSGNSFSQSLVQSDPLLPGKILTQVDAWDGMLNARIHNSPTRFYVVGGEAEPPEILEQIAKRDVRSKIAYIGESMILGKDYKIVSLQLPEAFQSQVVLSNRKGVTQVSEEQLKLVVTAKTLVHLQVPFRTNMDLSPMIGKLVLQFRPLLVILDYQYIEHLPTIKQVDNCPIITFGRRNGQVAFSLVYFRDQLIEVVPIHLSEVNSTDRAAGSHL